MGLMVLGVVLLGMRTLVTNLYLNFGYLELARRPPAAARARDFLYQAQRIDPEASGVSRALGILALEEGDGANAYALLKRASANQLPGALEHFQLGRALEALGNSKAAADEFQLAGASSFFVNAALRLRHQKDWHGAEQNYLHALDIVPRDPTIARSVGEFYREWNEPERAQLYLAHALEFELREYERALLRGELADLNDDAGGAEREYQAAILQNPNKPEAYRLLAELYLVRGNRIDATRILETGAMRAFPAFGLELRLAQVLIERNGWSAAENALARANTEQPNSDEVFLITGQLELARDNPNAALTALEHALAIAPHNAEIHFWYGRALAQAAQCDAARIAYAEAIALAPDDARFAPARQEWGTCK